MDIFDYPTHPYTVGLFGALPKLDGDETRLSPVDGLPPDPTNLPSGCAFWPRCPHATESCKCIAAEGQEAPQIPNMEITPGHFVRCLYAADLMKKEVQ